MIEHVFEWCPMAGSYICATMLNCSPLVQLNKSTSPFNKYAHYNTKSISIFVYLLHSYPIPPPPTTPHSHLKLTSQAHISNTHILNTHTHTNTHTRTQPKTQRQCILRSLNVLVVVILNNVIHLMSNCAMG